MHTHERSTSHFYINCKSDFILFSQLCALGRFMEFLKDRRVGMTIDVPVGNDAISLLKSSSSSSRFYIRNNRSPLKAGLNFSSSSSSFSFLFFSFFLSSFPFFFFSRKREIEAREGCTTDYKFVSPYFATSLKSCRFFISPRYICYRVRSRELYQ